MRHSAASPSENGFVAGNTNAYTYIGLEIFEIDIIGVGEGDDATVNFPFPLKSCSHSCLKF